MTTNQERALGVIDAELAKDPEVYEALFGDEPGAIVYELEGANLLMPDLPEPAYEGSTTWHVPGKNEWSTDTYKGKVMLEVDIEEPGVFGTSEVTKTWFMDRDEARALIGALLAALSHAEQEQQ